MVNLVNQKFTTMMSYYLDLAGSFVYMSSAVLLAAKLKIKSAVERSPGLKVMKTCMRRKFSPALSGKSPMVITVTAFRVSITRV